MTRKFVYMDNNATTPIHPEVKNIIKKSMNIFGNPSSLYSCGRLAREHVEKAREKIASFIGALSEEIIFVGSGSEANNTVLSIFLCVSKICGHDWSKGRDIITTKIEHPCVLEASKCLKSKGFNVCYLDVDKFGKINIEQLKDMLTAKTKLVSVMMANNEIGTIQDIKSIADVIHKTSNALFHTDAVQAIGKIPVDVKDLGVDFLTLSGHKMYGPKGIGVLYAKKGVEFCPFIRGGHQEKGRRAGTENTLGIMALGKAIEMRRKEMKAEHLRLKGFKDILKTSLEKNIADIQFNGHPEDSLAGTLNISFDGAEGEAVLLYLDLEGIAVSTGSACASGSLDPSHVLLATGVKVERAHGSIRISLGRENTKEDIEYAMDVFPRVIAKVRKMSTAYSNRRKQ